MPRKSTRATTYPSRPQLSIYDYRQQRARRALWHDIGGICMALLFGVAGSAILVTLIVLIAFVSAGFIDAQHGGHRQTMQLLEFFSFYFQ